MRILLIVHHFPPDVNSTGLLMSQIFQDLAAEGHRVRVITTFPHYEGFRTWPEYKGRLRKTDEVDGMRVTRVYSYASGTKSMKRRLVNYLSFNLMALLTGLFSRQGYDAVFCTNGSFFSGITGWLIAKTRRAKVIYNLQDLYPEVPVIQGQLTSRRAIRSLEKIERFMYARADRLAVITPSFQQNLERKGVPAEKISVIPNFVDTDFIRPLSKDNEFSRTHELVDKVVFTHAGNIGYVYDLETLLRGAELLSDRPDLLFLIIGEGVAKDALSKAVSQRDLKNVRFLPFQPYDQLPSIRAASDVQLSLYKAGAAAYSMPSKIYEAMASGRPLLVSADPSSDVWKVVEEVGCGLCVPPGDPGQLASAMIELALHPGARKEMGEAGRLEAERCYSRKKVSEAYKNLLLGQVKSF